VNITIKARAQRAGDVLLLTVQTALAARAVTGQAFGTPIHFYQTQEPGTWQALVGVDVDVPPGDHGIEIAATSETGEEMRETRTLAIQARNSPARHLTLPEKYVNPPESVQERIRAESEQLKTIFSTVSAGRLWEGGFARPVPGRVISDFGKQSILNGQPRSVHSGVDLRAASGTPLKAPAAGRVILVKDLYFAGNSVIIDHGLGLYSHLAHLSRFRVKEGQLVERGEIVGYTGQSGRVQGPHLHWSVRLCNSRIDPIAVLWVLGNREPGQKRRAVARASGSAGGSERE